ncbi:MAG: hypothetical protein LIO79_08890 [Rikenellaceae bacterium]|nr:hypothetical protein [Rikenellaceae bacterium]
MKINKDEILPTAAIVLCGTIIGIITRLYFLEVIKDKASANWIMFVIITGFVLFYFLFMELFIPIFDKVINYFINKKKNIQHINAISVSKLQEQIDIFCRYSDDVLNGYTSNDNLILLHKYIEQYAHGNMGNISQKIETSGLDKCDLYHYGWNIWNYFDVVQQPDTADWLINVFSQISGSKRIIYKKLKHDERSLYKISIEPNIKY